MSEYTPEELYGLTIDEYADELGTTVGGLIWQKEKEIELLENQAMRLMDRRDKDMAIAMQIRAIHTAIHKKTTKLYKFKIWMKRGKQDGTKEQ